MTKAAERRTRLKAYEHARDKVRHWAVKLDAARSALAKDCDHPMRYVDDYSWEHDNGYGRQTMRTGKLCGICHAVKYYEWSEWRPL